MEKSIGEQIKANGWRQGSIVRRNDVITLLKEINLEPNENEYLIIISQSCDLVHADIDTEPFAELIICEKITQKDGNFEFSKNPRKLHLTIEKIDRTEVAIECLAYNRQSINRQLLTEIDPDNDSYLPKRQLDSLVHWLASRYDRAALPDAFNNRIRKTESKRKKIANKLSEQVIGLYVNIYPFEELKDQEKYNVQLLAMVIANYAGELEEIESQVEKIKILLEESNMSVQAKVLKEDKVTVALINEFKRFPLEYLSLANDLPQPAPSRL